MYATAYETNHCSTPMNFHKQVRRLNINKLWITCFLGLKSAFCDNMVGQSKRQSKIQSHHFGREMGANYFNWTNCFFVLLDYFDNVLILSYPVPSGKKKTKQNKTISSVFEKHYYYYFIGPIFFRWVMGICQQISIHFSSK